MRTDVALSHESMINISAQAGHSQPCDTFGVHSSLPLLAELFKEGQAALANIGNLVEPVTRSSYENGSARLPRSGNMKSWINPRGAGINPLPAQSGLVRLDPLAA